MPIQTSNTILFYYHRFLKQKWGKYLTLKPCAESEHSFFWILLDQHWKLHILSHFPHLFAYYQQAVTTIQQLPQKITTQMFSLWLSSSFTWFDICVAKSSPSIVFRLSLWIEHFLNSWIYSFCTIFNFRGDIFCFSSC